MTPESDVSAPVTNTAATKASENNLGFFLVGGYLTLLGVIRLYEVLPLALGPYVVDGFPDWLLPYLAFLTALVCMCGLVLLFAGISSHRGSPYSGKWSLLGGTGILLFTVMHAVFLVLYERAFADGGIIWGVIHLLTLTRLPTTGTDAGTFGYKIGLGVGSLLWAVMGLYVIGESTLRLRANRPSHEVGTS